MNTDVSNPIFALGLLVASPAALEVFARYGVRASDVVAKHVRGEWPDMETWEREENMRAIKENGRVEGRYRLNGPPVADVVVVSEMLRRVTYVLLLREAQSLLDLVPVGDGIVELRPPGCRTVDRAPPLVRGRV